MGRGFVAGERLTLSVFLGSLHTATIVAHGDGSFRVRFPVASRSCLVWRALIVGTRSGRATFREPAVDCRPEPSWPPPKVGAGIAGVVRRGPIRPVCVVELPCDAPAPGVVVEVAEGTRAVARVITDADGRFLVQVPPGMYVVGVVGRYAASVRVTVRTETFSNVRLLIDTGIR